MNAPPPPPNHPIPGPPPWPLAQALPPWPLAQAHPHGPWPRPTHLGPWPRPNPGAHVGMHGFVWVCTGMLEDAYAQAYPCIPYANPDVHVQTHPLAHPWPWPKAPPMALALYPTTQPPHPPAAHSFWHLSNFLRIGGGSEKSANMIR